MHGMHDKRKCEKLDEVIVNLTFGTYLVLHD
jgi:hypothetical protein